MPSVNLKLLIILAIVAVGSVEVSSLADINLALEKAKSMNRDSVLLFVVTAAGESTQKAVKLGAK